MEFFRLYDDDGQKAFDAWVNSTGNIIKKLFHDDTTPLVIMKKRRTNGSTGINNICDPPCENPPCSHLVVIRETGI